MNVLMVYPRYPVTYWGFQHALRFVGKKAAHPPLGLLTVAALLPEDWDVKLVDCNVRKLKNSHIDEADLVFVSAMSIQKWDTKRVIARCKERGRTVVAGGPLFTAEGDLFPEVDHLLCGEAEATLPQFLVDLSQGRPGARYDAQDRTDIKNTPAPRWELADMSRYAQMSIQYSRGCPFDCEFCDIGVLFGRGVRAKGTPQFLAELDSLLAAGWRGDVFLVDDNFIGHRARVRDDLLPALAAWTERRDRPFTFGTEVSIDLADDPVLIDRMVDAGFHAVFAGIETVNDDALVECEKHQNRDRDLVQSVRRIQQGGLELTAGFILGFDSDTPSVFRRVGEFIDETGIVSAMVGLLNAPKGTRLYERLSREGRLLHDGTGDNTDGTINFRPKMDMDTLLSGYRDVLARLYDPASYYARIRTFLRNYQPRSNGKRFHPVHLWALARSVVRLGIVGRERRHFWSLLAWTARTRPRLVPKAVTLSIYGFHFRMLFAAGG